MQIFKYPSECKTAVSFPVIAIGFFDGVHLAHRELIAKAKEIAKEKNSSCAVFTFSSEDKGLKRSVSRLYSTDDKLKIFSTLGIDGVAVADFESLKDLSAERFVREVLVDGFGCRCAVVGFNFRFGKNASGDATYLGELMRSCGGDAVIVEDYKMRGETVSSTRIRALLSDGKCAEAAELLGMPYFIGGKVDHGRGDGRSFGFPTVNTEICGIELKHGVYRTVLDIDGIMYQGLTNIGICPTLGARVPHAETYILDFDGDLYGRTVRIFLIEFLREEKCFSTKEELIMQINIDKNIAIERNKNTKWQECGLSLQ